MSTGGGSLLAMAISTPSASRYARPTISDYPDAHLLVTTVIKTINLKR